MTGHLLGFTNIDDAGQEGLELAFDHWLAGEQGAKRVIQDRYGRIVQNVESIRPARPGRDLVLSIDLRIQYLAYRELKAAIRDQRARAGSVVVLDVDTGEVLANQANCYAVALGQFAEQLAEFVGLLLGLARGRLVEQHQSRLGHQRACELHPPGGSGRQLGDFPVARPWRGRPGR